MRSQDIQMLLRRLGVPAGVIAVVVVVISLISGGGEDSGQPTQNAEPPPPITQIEPEPTIEQNEPEDEGAAATGNRIPGEEGDAVATVLRRIDGGEQHPYSQDGGTFQNREGRLPEHPIGYYREYTVETPGSPDRGARRLVIGDGGETYYTRDHYGSFDQISPDDYL